MEKKYQIFVSSTYEDLIEERKEISQALLEIDCIPTGMELFPASNKKQWDIIKGVIDDCDYYLLIIGGRYGHLGENDKGEKVGYTEMEFDYAKMTGKPIIAFIHKDIGSIEAERSERTKRGVYRLKKFIKKASDGREVNYWKNKDHLRSLVTSSVPKLIKSTPANGWVKVGTGIDESAIINDVSMYATDIFSGVWKSKNGEGAIDSITLKYNPKDQMIGGEIKGCDPKDKRRKWKCFGCVVGESLLLTYYSHERRSAGCGLLRVYKDNQYFGNYLRYNYGTNEIDNIALEMEKIIEDE